MYEVNSMKQFLFVTIALLLSLGVANANLLITEIMHSPEGISDSDGEWVEVYNNGSNIIDLSKWTLNDKDFDDTMLLPHSYLVIARELLDSDDTDLESFEAFWGNNNHQWDEPYLAVDGSLSLKEDGTIVITNGIERTEVAYSSAIGGKNGRSIELTSSGAWGDGPVNGTPGSGPFDSFVSTWIDFTVVVNSTPAFTILSVNGSKDDSPEQGVQIIPSLGENTTFFVDITADIEEGRNATVNATLGETHLTVHEQASQLHKVYRTDVSLPFETKPGDYTITIVISDGNHNVTTYYNFTYMKLLAFDIDTNNVSLAIKEGENKTMTFSIINIGNVPVIFSILLHKEVNITFELETDDGWTALEDDPVSLPAILPGQKEAMTIRTTVPFGTPNGSYSGKLFVEAQEGA